MIIFDRARSSTERVNLSRVFLYRFEMEAYEAWTRQTTAFCVSSTLGDIPNFAKEEMPGDGGSGIMTQINTEKWGGTRNARSK